MWPISPAPPRPRQASPSSTTPPPTPVPQKTPSNDEKGRPAPRWNSAAVATCTSLPRRTSGPSSCFRVAASGNVPPSPGRLPARVTLAAFDGARRADTDPAQLGYLDLRLGRGIAQGRGHLGRDVGGPSAGRRRAPRRADDAVPRIDDCRLDLGATEVDPAEAGHRRHHRRHHRRLTGRQIVLYLLLQGFFAPSYSLRRSWGAADMTDRNTGILARICTGGPLPRRDRRRRPRRRPCTGQLLRRDPHDDRRPRRRAVDGVGNRQPRADQPARPRLQDERDRQRHRGQPRARRSARASSWRRCPESAEVTLEQAKAALQSAEASLAKEEETDGETSTGQSTPAAGSGTTARAASASAGAPAATTPASETTAQSPARTREPETKRRRRQADVRRERDRAPTRAPARIFETSSTSTSLFHDLHELHLDRQHGNAEANLASARATVKATA